MLEAITYEKMLNSIAHNGVASDAIGILITRPESAVGIDIMSDLNYYHHFSGESINFFLPGYGAYWYGTYPDGKVVTKIDGVEWSFSDRMFVEFIKDLEAHSSWQYSGESELLLVEYTNGVLLFDKILQFHLDNMLRDHIITSIGAFFQKLFRESKGDKSLNKLSNRLGRKTVSQVAMEAVLKALPCGLGNLYEKEKYYCVKNCKKR